MWTKISYYSGPQFGYKHEFSGRKQILDLVLQLSRQSPLDLHINFEETDANFLVPMIHTFCIHSKRWKSFTMKITNKHSWDDIHDAINSVQGNLSLLEELMLYIRHRGLRTSSIFRHAPKLQRATVCGYVHLPWSQIQQLWVVTPAPVQFMLLRCTQLKMLDVKEDPYD